MAYYTRKPELVEAVQWTGNNLQEIKDFVGNDSKISIAFKNPNYAYLPCYVDYVDIDEYNGNEANIDAIYIYIGPGNVCQCTLNDYIIKHDYSDNPELYPFESMKAYRFKILYQPDSCSLDGSGCE